MKCLIQLYRLHSKIINYGFWNQLEFTFIYILFNHSVVSNSLWPHGLQHAGFPCLSLSPGICLSSFIFELVTPSNPSVIPFSSCLQSFPASGSFPMSQFFALGGQSLGISASVLPVNIEGWFPLGLMVWFPYCPRESQESSPTPPFKNINSALSFLYGLSSSHIGLFWLYGPLSAKSCLCFLIGCPGLSLLFSKGTSVACFIFVAAVPVHSYFGAQENKVCHYLHCLPTYLSWSDGTGCLDLSFLNILFIYFLVIRALIFSSL